MKSVSRGHTEVSGPLTLREDREPVPKQSGGLVEASVTVRRTSSPHFSFTVQGFILRRGLRNVRHVLVLWVSPIEVSRENGGLITL